MVLSKRLQAVASLVTPGGCPADIGCDHGYVPVALIKEGTCPRAIAADVRPGPLERARQHIREAGLEDRIETRLSDGLSSFSPGEADTLILSGIGGMLLIRILTEGDACARAARELILSPQSDLEAVRRYLKGSGYRIDRETVLEEEGKFYHILRVLPVPDAETWSEADYCLGKRFSPDCAAGVLAFLEKEERKAGQIEQKLKTRAADGESACARLARIGRLQELIREKKALIRADTVEG